MEATSSSIRRKLPIVPVWLLLAVSSLHGGSGGVFQRSPPKPPAPSGLRMKLDTQWVSGNGYRPVTVEFSNSPAGTRATDRSLSVVFIPQGEYRNRADQFTHFVELPAGAPSVTTTISIPQFHQWYAFEIQVYEDGVFLDDLSFAANSNSVGRRPARDWNERTPAVLIIDGDAPTRADRFVILHGPNLAIQASPSFPEGLPDFRALSNLVLQTGMRLTGPPDGRMLLNLLENSPRLELLPLHDLPNRWIDYTCLDIIIVSLPDLLSIQSKQPKVFEAIHAWVASGPTLCVYDVGSEYTRLSKLEALLELDQIPSAGAQEWNRGWSVPDTQNNLGGLHHMIADYPGITLDVVEDEILIRGNTVEAAESEPGPFVWRRASMGTVVAIASTDPFASGHQDWAWILNSIKLEKWAWGQRHGISLSAGNAEYWKFLIPGVGLPPVTAFCIFITLFVIVIGPVNYYLLRRKRRLYLLLVTVPGGAAVITFGLLAYAVLSDGLGVRLRARSFTMIDQRQERAVSWSRQSYYAGMVPSRGIAFADDAAVYPIETTGYDSYYRRGNEPPAKHIVWENRQQRLARGFLRSRVHSQFLVVRARKSTARLDIREPEDGSPPQVVNHLNTRIEKLFLVDSGGNAFAAEDIQPGATFRPKSTVVSDAVNEIARLVQSNALEYPEGQNSRSNWSRARRRGPYYEDELIGYDQRGQPIYGPSQDTNILESNLRLATKSPSAGGLLGPKTYLAIVETSPEVPLGAEISSEDASFHVVFGKW